MRGAVAAALAALLTGCTSSAADGGRPASPEPPGTTASIVGPSAGFGHRLRVAIDGAAARITVGRPRRVNGERYALRVTILGRSGTFDVNPHDFRARDEARHTLDALGGGVADQLDTSSVTPGDVLRGRVAFDVAKGDRIVAVDYVSVLGDVLATWSSRP
jgi:hypothetical protein